MLDIKALDDFCGEKIHHREAENEEEHSACWSDETKHVLAKERKGYNKDGDKHPQTENRERPSGVLRLEEIELCSEGENKNYFRHDGEEKPGCLKRLRAGFIECSKKHEIEE